MLGSNSQGDETIQILVSDDDDNTDFNHYYFAKNHERMELELKSETEGQYNNYLEENQ